MKTALHVHPGRERRPMREAANIRDALPRIFGLEDIRCSLGDAGDFNCRAILYHDQACVTVSFNCAERNPDLEIGKLVSVRWLPAMQSHHGAIRVAGLAALNCPAGSFNPFLAVPRTWNIDRHLIDCARGLWDISLKEMRRLLFSTVLARVGYPKRQ